MLCNISWWWRIPLFTCDSNAKQWTECMKRFRTFQNKVKEQAPWNITFITICVNDTPHMLCSSSEDSTSCFTVPILSFRLPAMVFERFFFMNKHYHICYILMEMNAAVDFHFKEHHKWPSFTAVIFINETIWSIRYSMVYNVKKQLCLLHFTRWIETTNHRNQSAIKQHFIH